MSENITSYSPVTRSWTEDPHSIKDSKGREVMYLTARPQDLPHNPKCGYLMCERLVMLDHNNRPIKAYPGAPRTLAADTVEPRAFLLEGLRRVLGMTIFDVRARMPGEYDTPNGRRRLQKPSIFTNRVMFWRKFHNLDTTENLLGTWHKRRTPKATTKAKGTNPSNRLNEGETTIENFAEGVHYPDNPPTFLSEYISSPQITNESDSYSYPSALSPPNISTETPDDLGSECMKWDDFVDLDS